FNNLLDHAIGGENSNIDFAKHAEAMGATAGNVSSIADLEKMHDKWGDRVRHVHFKDVRQPALGVHAKDRSFLGGVASGVYSVPGDPEGCIDFQTVTDKLKAMDYTGWIVVEAEQDPAKAPPFEYSKLGYDRIVDNCTCSGLTIERWQVLDIGGASTPGQKFGHS
uniref:TIM barrel protein n=1 Tax=unclassified Mameliella TaxID=2630630 RepID=UPI00273F298B